MLCHFQETYMLATVSSLSIFHAGCIDTTCFKSLALQGRKFAQGKGGFSVQLYCYWLSLLFPLPSAPNCLLSFTPRWKLDLSFFSFFPTHPHFLFLGTLRAFFCFVLILDFIISFLFISVSFESLGLLGTQHCPLVLLAL